MMSKHDPKVVSELPPPMRDMMRQYGISDDTDWLTAMPMLRAAIQKCGHCPYQGDCRGRSSTFEDVCPNAEIFKLIRDFGPQS